jgi:uncharacterized protein YndB with AHSA1/START domain/DNA-binding transcriptional ArsR family regulator
LTGPRLNSTRGKPSVARNEDAAHADAVFRALADPIRRLLLDRIRDRPGITLKELHAGLDMTRFGVMRHLSVLEEAGLIVTRKDGRSKRHFLNSVAIEEAVGRYISQFARNRAQTLLGLKDALDQQGDFDVTTDALVFQIVINAPPAKVWNALTQGDFTKLYFFETMVELNSAKGSPIKYRYRDGSTAVEGEVLDITEPKKLVISWHPCYDPVLARETPSRVTFELEERGPFTLLTVIHDEFPAESKVAGEVSRGWPFILSNLKTLLETGKPMGRISGLT